MHSEADDLARACATAYQKLLAYYREQGEGEALVRLPSDRALTAPSAELRWIELDNLLERDPATAMVVWERVKQDAAGYVREGYHIADALRFTSPWARAKFITIRRALIQDWQPSGEVEQALLDTYASAYSGYIHWLGQAQERAMETPRDIGQEHWDIPRLTVAEAVDQAMVHADRFHRQMVRALRGMRDLRRYSITIQGSVGQLNVANQQINATKIEQ